MFRKSFGPFGGLFPSGVPDVVETPRSLVISGAPPREPIAPWWPVLRTVAGLTAIALIVVLPGDILTKALLLGAAVVIAGAAQSALDRAQRRTIVLTSGGCNLAVNGDIVPLGEITGAGLRSDSRGEHVLWLNLSRRRVPLIRGEREALLSLWDDIARAAAAWSEDGKAPPLNLGNERFPRLAPPESG